MYFHLLHSNIKDKTSFRVFALRIILKCVIFVQICEQNA